MPKQFPVKRRVLIAPDFGNDLELHRIIDNIEYALSSLKARIFKNDHTATVGAVPFHDSWLVIKKYNRYSRWKRFHLAFRKSRARNTWEGVHRLRAVGVDTVEPVALLEYRVGPFCVDACFIGKLLVGTDARAFFTSRDIPDGYKREAARNIIRSLRKMHASDISHGDTKDVNILIHEDRRISWVDLDAMRLGAPGIIRKKNIRKDWLLLLYNWRNHPDVLDMFVEELQKHLDKNRIASLLKGLAGRRKKKRTPASNTGNETGTRGKAFPAGLQRTKFRVIGARGEKITLHLYAPEHSDLAYWKEIAKKYWTGALEGLQRHPSSRKALVESCMLGRNRYYFKRFFPRDTLDHGKQIFRKSRAYRDMKGISQARARGLRVPEVCCVIESRKWGIRLSGIIVTREVASSIQLRHLLEGYRRNGDFRSRRRLMRELGREMAKWHLAGMRHGDARDTNILCHIPESDTSDGRGITPVDFCWLDNERSRPVCRKREFPRNLVQLNMTRCGVTRTDRMRFWKTYWVDAGQLYHPQPAGTILRKIVIKTRKRWKLRGWL